MEYIKWYYPWPISPNMTPNWNGNVIIVLKAGLTSLYLGISYVSTICWDTAVKQLVLKWVGGVCGVSL